MLYVINPKTDVDISVYYLSPFPLILGQGINYGCFVRDCGIRL